MSALKFFILISILFFTSIIFSKENPAYNTKKFIDEWLLLGSVNLEYPAMMKDSTSALKSILTFEDINIQNLEPTKGEVYNWNKNSNYTWKELLSDFGEIKINSTKDSSSPQVAYLAAYLNAERWINASIEIKSCQPFELFLDGNLIHTKDKINLSGGDTLNCENEKVIKELKLETGKHILILKTLNANSPKINNWKIESALIIDSTFKESELTSSISPTKNTSINNLLDDPKISSVSISPDGKLSAIQIAQVNDNGASKENWIEIFNAKDGSRFQTFRGGINISSLSWYPKGEKITYTTSEKNNTTLWMNDLQNGEVTKLLEDVENFGSYNWSPDGSYLIYSITEKAKGNKTGLIKLDELGDRLPNSKDKSFLYLLNYPQLTKQKLTAGENTTSVNNISRDGKKIIFSISKYDYKKQPYSFSTYYILNLANMFVDSLFSQYWGGSAQFSPNAEKILITGNQEIFNGLSVATSSDQTPNKFNTQAFIYDLKTKQVNPITKNFNPAILDAYWSGDEVIYFRTVDKTFENVYEFNLNSKEFKEINLSADVVKLIDYSTKNSLAIYTGSSVTTPDMAYVVDLENRKSKLIYNPTQSSYKNIKLGKTESWTFRNERNETIDGRIYYPPNFDNTKKYPCIVNYYGGTTPVEQNFEGRYPANIWAANGYVVYILQPSGAIGYGQKFAAHHVNDWGEKTAQEVITGTKQFLAAHLFVDSSKVGCIGASYGGFLTMNLLTKTKIFAVAVAHAGISSLAGYWGEGYWGYTYSAGATAEAFPWNRKDIYIDRSPLFNADKISTPLLLLHGMEDTNVPTGQSIQMFTALKLLGKPVDFIEVEGQDHHIMEYGKRKLWTKSIIAWFDKYLKDQPQWYNDLYPNEK